MKTGIVLEILNNRAVVLKSDGSFQTVPSKSGWRKGDRVPIQEYNKVKAAILAVCLFLFITIAWGGYYYYTEAAVISIDVNPSMELVVNHFGRVISVKAYNTEAEGILNLAAAKNKKYEDILLFLFSGREIDSYLNENEYLVITVQTDEKEEKVMLDKIKEIVSTQLFPDYEGLTVECIPVDRKLLEKAHQNGYTAGKYKVFLELQELLTEAEPEEYIHHSICELKEDISDYYRQQQIEEEYPEILQPEESNEEEKKEEGKEEEEYWTIEAEQEIEYDHHKENGNFRNHGGCN